MPNQTLAARAAALIVAIQNCQRPGFNGHPDYPEKHIEALEALALKHLPHGSGFDSGSTFDIDASSAECLVIRTSFHHMDENGFYCGWSHHVVRIRAHLAFGFVVRISGPNTREIKDYMGDVFYSALSTMVEG